MKKFITRVCSIALILACLLWYNTAVEMRNAEEAQARAAYEAQMAELGISLAPEYRDGAYTGSAQGYGGIVEMSVTIEEGKIQSVDVLSAANEDAAYWNAALGLIPNILAVQTADVDTVSGATFSSNGLLGAVDQALSQAIEE